MGKRILIWSLFLACCNFLHAQDTRFEYQDSALLNEAMPGETSEPVTYEAPTEEEPDILSDTTLYITAITISPDTVKAWKRERRFAYMKGLDSLLAKKQENDLRALHDRENDEPSWLEKLLASGIMQALFWMLAVCFVLFILYRLFWSEAIFKRNSRRSPVTVSAEPEALATVADYDKLIHQSIKLGDYRLAIRYHFLKTLSLLSDKELIQAGTDKTNQQYLQEVAPVYRDEFASLVRTYEYSWYGGVLLQQDQFIAVEKRFLSFYQKIMRS